MWEQIMKYETNQMLLAIFVIFVTILVLYLSYRSRKGRKQIVLLTGLCDSGKTLLFSQLIYERDSQTYTSMKENFADYEMKEGKLRIVDIPGHERLRSKYLDTYESTSKGVIFVIDSTTLKNDIRDAAEYLCSVYLRLIANNIKHLLILCNRHNDKGALSVDAVKELLEKEINTVTYTKSKQLEDVSTKGRKSSQLDEMSEFSFESSNIKTQFVTCPVRDTTGDLKLDGIKKWLASIV